MKKLIKAGLLIGLIFFMTGSAWALPIDAGDTVKLSVGGDAMYTMTNVNTNDDWDKYYTFCLESDIRFWADTKYRVESVEDYAKSGGIDNQGPYNDDPNWVSGDNKDYISDQTKWLFATYLTNPNAYNAWDVQQAIWWLEDEARGVESYWTPFFNLANGDYSVTGWDIKAINLVYDGIHGTYDIQSQLVGSYNPVPEPATMILFGIGLLGIAGMGRKKLNK